MTTFGIVLKADSSDMTSEFKRAENASKNLNKVVGKADKTIRKYSKSSNIAAREQKKLSDSMRSMHLAAKSFASVFVIGGIAASIRATVNYADSLGKLSTRLGISTEALSQLNHAANLSGLSFTTLELGLQRMIRRVAEAANGTGEAVKALDELGISASKLKTLSPDKQLEVLADALNGVEGSADRVRLAMKLFDSEGVKFLQLMEKGGAGIREMREEADRLGLTIDKSLSAQAAKANDEFTRFTGQMSALGNVLAIEVLPVVTEVTAAINQMFEAETQTRIEQINHKIGVFSRQIEAHNNNGVLGSLVDDLYEFDVNQVGNRVDSLIKERDRLQQILNKPISSKGADVSLGVGETNSANKGVAALNELTKAKVRAANIKKKLIDSVAAREQAALKGLGAAEIELLKATGNHAEAAQLEITARYKTMLDNLSGQSLVRGKEIVANLISKENLQISLDSMKRQVNDSFDEMANKESSIGISVDTGLMTEIEGRSALLQIHKETGQALEKVVNEMEALAIASGDKSAANAIAALRNKIKGLSSESAELAVNVQTTLNSAFSTVFLGIGKDINSAEDALKAFTLSVLDSIAQIAAREASEAITGVIVKSLFSAATTSSYHTGGDNLTGREGKQMAIKPSIFTNAPRFHSGLKSDEFPAILQTGEDVIARNDPRNSRNGGGSTVINVESVVTIEGGNDQQQKQAKAIGKLVETSITRALVKEKRPGGLLA